MPEARASWRAVASHHSLPAGRASGIIVIEGNVVRFDGDEVSQSLPIERLRVRIGGASDRLVFFESPDEPDWSLYTSDRSILRHPALTSHPSVSRQLSAMERKRWSGHAITISILLMIAAAVWLLFELRTPLASFLADRVPPEIEAKIGDAAFRQIRLTQGTIDDPELIASLETIMHRISSAIPPDRRRDFRIHVMNDPSVNAFALPGGTMAFNRGLIMEAESAEEIAAVMAHEMAHVTERHSLRQIISAVGLWVMVQALLGDASGVIAVAADSGAHLLTLRFSRDAEREADATGLAYLRDAGIDPDGMLTFLRRLHAVEQSAGTAGALSEELAFLQTHPATAERIGEVRALIDAIDIEPRPLDTSIDEMKRRLQRVEQTEGKKP